MTETKNSVKYEETILLEEIKLYEVWEEKELFAYFFS